MMNETLSYTLVELSKKSKQSTEVLRAYINAGKLEATKVRRGYRISGQEADRFMEDLDANGVMGFADVTIKKPIEYGSDGTADKIFGIPVGDIFSFMMKILQTIKEYNVDEPIEDANRSRVTIEDIKLLRHIINEGKISVIPREKRVIVMDSDPTTAFLVRSMATGISCTFDELSKQQNFSIEADKIKSATDYIVGMLE